MRAIIQTVLPANVGEEFYLRLNFKKVENPYLGELFADGPLLLRVSDNVFDRPGILLVKDNWAEELNLLEHHAEIMPVDFGYLLSDPAGVRIYLIQHSPEVHIASSLPGSFLGNFDGISIETTGLYRSLKFWKLLGFEQIGGSLERGCVIIKGGGSKISLMKANSCPHLFFNPSLTYFNGKKNIQIISALRQLNIPIAEEVTVFNREGKVDNLVLQDPGGLGIFVFNDEPNTQ